ILLSYAFASLTVFLISFVILLNYFYDMQVRSLTSNYSALLNFFEGQYKIEFQRIYETAQKNFESIYKSYIIQKPVANKTLEETLKDEIQKLLPIAYEIEIINSDYLKDTLYGQDIMNYIKKSKRDVDYVIYNIYNKGYYTKIFFIKFGDKVHLFKVDLPYYLKQFETFVKLKDYNEFISYIDVLSFTKDEVLKHIDGTYDKLNKSKEEEKSYSHIFSGVRKVFKEEKVNIFSNFVKYWDERYEPSKFESRSSLSELKGIKTLSMVRAYFFLNLLTEREIGDPIVGIIVLNFSNLVSSVVTLLFFLTIFTMVVVHVILDKEAEFVNEINVTFSRLIDSLKTFGKTKIFTDEMVNFTSNISEIQDILEEYTKVAQELTAAYEEQIALTQELGDSYKEIEYSHNQLEKSYLEFANQLAIIAENYDENTGSHITRVAKLSRFIAENIGCDNELLDKIEKFAPLHDIGKVLIPKEILLKNGPLTNEEFEIMKQHTILGAKLIGDNPNLEIAKNIALYHHEKYDGTGYPFGKKGEEIPLEAKIVALVDVYDALRSDRPYKKGFSHQESVHIILNGDKKTQPTHFDPVILEIFKKYANEIEKLWNDVNVSIVNGENQD
ncbi:MAG: HD-GYP domain-containing protein, partial [Fervidobacterium sp.]